MNKQPTEEQLIAYIYGECNSEEARHIEQCIKENPDVRKEYEAMRGMRKVLAFAEDKEVLEPAVHFDRKDIVLSHNPQLAGGYWPGWKWLSVAAAIALLLIAGNLTKTNFQIGKGGFSLSFGEPSNEAEMRENLKAELLAELSNRDKQLIDYMDGKYDHRLVSMEESISEYGEQLDDRLVAFKAQYRQELALAINRKLNEDETLRTLMAGMQESNRREMEKIIAMASIDQQQAILSALNDFNTYYNSQRIEDLQMIESGLVSLAKDAEQRQLETTQYLSNLIVSVTQPN